MDTRADSPSAARQRSPGIQMGVEAAGMCKVSDVAARLNCSPSFVYRMIATGKLPHYRLGTGKGGIRVSEAQLQSFLAQHENGGRSASAAPRTMTISINRAYRNL
jgi:excisionase family DNA binding protein